jgi:hypothetical protein
MHISILRISILALFLSPFATAQELTSDVSGTVTSADGPVSGAVVEIIYQPTNSTVTKTTGANGKYFAGGLRPGGPYVINVTASGLVKQNKPTTLIVGETRRVSFGLTSLDSLDDVVVTASRIGFDKSGFTTIIDSETIETAPSVTRDLQDILRLNPMVSIDNEEDGEESISIGGAHPRTNDIKVDGVSFNDDFGLNSNGYPSQRSPINFNAVDQLAIKIAPVSVEYSQFRGGVIDIITKGGTNEFHGDVSYFDRGDRFQGDKVNGQAVDIQKEDTAIELSFGGPIIKDELFFFATYGSAEIANPLEFGAIGSGAENILDISAAQIAEIRAAAIAVVGRDPLGGAGSTKSEQENITLRLDWNINDNHRLTYNFKEVSGDQVRGTRSSRSSLALASSTYLKSEITTTNSFHLVSDLSENLISEFYFSTKDTSTDQVSPAGQNYPSFRVDNAFGYRIDFGPDIYRSANDLENTTTFFKGKLTYYMDDHKFTAGFENTVYDTFNLFIVREDGEFRFRSLDDLKAGNIRSYKASGSKTGNVNDAAAAFEFEQFSMYVMDEWTMSDRLKLTFGARYDKYDGDDTKTNQDFVNKYGFKNGGISGTDLINIRFGLDYAIDDMSDINITLGTYASKLPNVWISNAYSNTGTAIANYDPAYATSPCDTSTLAGFVFSGSNVKPDCVISSIENPLNNTSKVDFIAPSFEWPVSKILNVTYTRLLPYDLDMTLTYLYSEEEEALYRIIDTGYPLVGDQPTVPTEKAPDGRPIYNQTGDSSYAAGLYNQCCGERSVLSGSLSKAFRDGDTRISLSYTGQDAQNRNAMTSSTSNSNFGKTGAIDFNNRQVGRSTYETKHRILATLSSKHYFFGSDKPTQFNLVFTRESGGPKYPTFDTYTGRVSDYKSRAFGYEFNLNDDSSSLLYIPTLNDPLICWTGGCEDEGSAAALAREAAVLDLLYNTFGLKDYAGKIGPRDAGSFPYQNSLDLNIIQTLPGFREDDSFVVTFAVENLLNLMDNAKGVVNYGYYSGRIPVIDMKIVDGKYDYSRYAFRYDATGNPFNINTSTTQSLWRASLGFQYKF